MGIINLTKYHLDFEIITIDKPWSDKYDMGVLSANIFIKKEISSSDFYDAP